LGVKVENVYNTSPLPPMDPAYYAYIENRSL